MQSILQTVGETSVQTPLPVGMRLAANLTKVAFPTIRSST